MFRPRTVVPLLVLLWFLVQPTTARAQGVSDLRACNKGTVPVQVVVAQAQGTFVYSWAVLGKTIAPGWCDEFPGQSVETLIAFGAKDSRGRFVSLKATSLPNLGDRNSTLSEIAQNGGRLRTLVLSRDARTICVGATYTFYSTRDTRVPAPAECEQLSLPDVGRLLPITTSYSLSLPTGGGLVGYFINVRANPDRGEVTVTEADENGADTGSAPASVPNTASTSQTRMLLGRRVTLGADRRWHFDDGLRAFDNLGLQVSDAFFDVQLKPGASIAPADADRANAIMTDIGRLLSPTDVQTNLEDWGDRGRLCFAWSGNIRCANVEGLDLDATTFTDTGVLFHCRGTLPCAFIASPWKESDGAKVKLDGRDWTLGIPQRALFVSHLPNQTVARALAAKIHELAEISTKYREPPDEGP